MAEYLSCEQSGLTHVVDSTDVCARHEKLIDTSVMTILDRGEERSRPAVLAYKKDGFPYGVKSEKRRLTKALKRQGGVQGLEQTHDFRVDKLDWSTLIKQP